MLRACRQRYYKVAASAGLGRTNQVHRAKKLFHRLTLLVCFLTLHRYVAPSVKVVIVVVDVIAVVVSAGSVHGSPPQRSVGIPALK